MYHEGVCVFVCDKGVCVFVMRVCVCVYHEGVCVFVCDLRENYDKVG